MSKDKDLANNSPSDNQQFQDIIGLGHLSGRKNYYSELQNKIDELESTRNYIYNIINSMPSFLIALDEQLRVTQWNKLAVDSTGIKSEAAKGLLFTELLPRFKSEENIIFQCIESKEKKELISRSYESSGHIFYENVLIYPLLLDSASGVVIRIDDVTKQKNLELQLNHNRKMDAIGQLAGGVAHDFNNMLGGILGAAQLLKHKNEVTGKGLNFVDLIIKTATRAADLTAKLLAFGRKGKTVSTAVDINVIINDTVLLLSRSIDKKIVIKTSLSARDHMVTGDNSQLQNAFMNICINASHAMPDGGEIEIATENSVPNGTLYFNECNQAPPDSLIKISFRDTGCGISEENLSKIFEPFFTTKAQGEGTGLGLAAVYGTVQDHHGCINVKSRVGEGTVFEIYLPVDQEIRIIQPKEEKILKGSGNVLLVDDEEIIRITAKMMLEELNYQVFIARDGREAIDIYLQKHAEIDLVILDMIMPVMNGSEAFIEMQKINPNIKAIAASGFSKDSSMEKMLKNGLKGFIRKPFRMSEFSQIISDTINTISNINS